MKKYSLLLLLVILLSGCLIQYEHSPDKQCPEHHVRLKHTLVPSAFGLAAYSYGSEQRPYAKPRSFNLGCVVPVWPIRRWVRISYCTVCTREEKQIKK